MMINIQVIAEHLSAEEVAGIKQGFDLMDTSKQGKINIVELKAGLQKLGQQIPDADLQILMDAVSTTFYTFTEIYARLEVAKCCGPGRLGDMLKRVHVKKGKFLSF